jgi:hypothetical protein
MSIKMKVGLESAIFVSVLTALAVPANAATIYSYTGNPYTTIAVPSSGYTTANRITATLTLANPLPPNQALAWGVGGIGTPTASDTLTGFVITDGKVTFTLSDTYNIFLVILGVCGFAAAVLTLIRFKPSSSWPRINHLDLFGRSPG